MSSKKQLKKDLNNRFGEIIDGALINQATGSEEAISKTEEFIDNIILEFDNFIGEINKKDVEDRAKHLKSIKDAINKKAEEFIGQLNSL